jgi:hypothetical protein
MKCPKYSFEITDELRQSYCKNCDGCGENPHSQGDSTMLPPVDISKLTQGLAEKKKQEIEQGRFIEKIIEDITIEKHEVKLEICPHCGERSWWLNQYTHRYECFNRKSCPTNSLSTFLTDYFLHSHPEDYQSTSSDASQLSNPILLGVKMFLADVIYIINSKYEEGHVCANFAQEVCDAATERGIRCGYVVMSFKMSKIAHAIVAFQTDYGLKFFEPQNGNEEDVKVGRLYSTILEGIPNDDIITKIEITWNDGTTTIID